MFLDRSLSKRGYLALALTTTAATTLALTMPSAASAGAGATAPVSAPAAGADGSGLYVVQMVGDPLATAAVTKPAHGHRLNARSATAQQLTSQLRGRQDSALAKAGVSSKSVVYHFATTLNGVAAHLSAKQAQSLAKDSSVLHLWKSHNVTIATPPTPKFLGLTGPNGVWKQQFGTDGNAGKGVIIGDIDTGYWPESPSFAALPEPRSDDAAIAAKWMGSCDPTVTCNSKVIGAQFFDAAGNSNLNPGEFKSPRDFDGHGSHTASTAAGDHVQHAMINGVDAGDLEGVAPGARLAIYKVLYENASGSTGTGSSVDIDAAIDKATSDGVDVINYSVGDNVDSFSDVELGFLNAAAAGVFVSAAAGNAGPGAATVDNAMPWETTVAAGTFDQTYSKTVTLGNGASYTGVGVGAAVPTAPIVDSASSGLSTAAPGSAEICALGSLDPAVVAGKIVLCARGVNNRTDKSKAVQQAGGVGMVLYNPSTNSLNADFHFVPTVHIDTAAGLAVKAYIAGTANPTASLSAGVSVKVEAPAVAAFSSRGPSISSGGDLLKPDIMGPGNDVIAAVSPLNHNGNLYDTESGTSMSTPHLAGVAALLISKHPDWAPMWVKSAIMTGAKITDNAGAPIQGANGNATPFDMGSGEVLPAAAFDTQLVYDSTLTNWLQYSCGIGVHLQTSTGDICDQVGTISPSDLNYPSIAFGALAGAQTTTRTVTNVTNKKVTYTAGATSPAGYKVKVSPTKLVIPAGGTATFSVTVTRTTAGFGSYSFGLLRLKDTSGHLLRSPIAVQAVPLSAPASLAGTGTSGSAALTLRAGYAGTLNASASGLVAGVPNTENLVQDPGSFNSAAPATGPGTMAFNFTVPAGTPLTRVQTRAEDYPANTDVDLYVYRDSGTALTLAGISASGSATETVDLTTPGNYRAYVDLFTDAAGAAVPLPVTGYLFSLGTANLGNVTVTPASQAVTNAGSATVTVVWTGLTAGTHYLGYVTYADTGSNPVGRTLLTVDP